MTAEAEAVCTVRILGIPVRIWAKAQESADELIREFTLIALGNVPGEREVPKRLTALLRRLRESYSHLGDAQAAVLQRAALEGVDTVDELIYEIPANVASAAVELGRMLDECDEYCAAGEHLLTLASDPAVRAFRSWFLGEISSQVAGGAPTPWAASSWAHGNRL